MSKFKIAAGLAIALPLIGSCSGGGGSAVYDDPNHGTIDARKLAKECVSLLKNNPKKFELNARYTLLCKSGPFSEPGELNSVVTGYMKLIRGGENIASISPDQVLGREPLKLTGKKSIWDERLQSVTLITHPMDIKRRTEQNELRFSEQYDNQYIIVKGFVDSVKDGHFWIKGGSGYEESHVQCYANKEGRSYLSRINKGDQIIAFGKYSFGNFMDLRGELRNCVWHARKDDRRMFEQYWMNTLSGSQMKEVIRNSPMYQGTKF